MKSFLYLTSYLLLLSGAALAQANQTASTRQLSSESLAVLTPAESSGGAAAVSRVYVGTVLNEKGMPLAGAIVAVGPGRDQRTVTNAEGAYMVRSTEAAPLMRVSYAGYEEVTLDVSSPQPVTFNLQPIDNYKRQLNKQARAAERAFYGH